MDGLTELDIEFVRLYADSNMHIEEVSRRMHFHRNTVRYHLDKVKKKTGLDPTNFYDLVKILRMIGVDI